MSDKATGFLWGIGFALFLHLIFVVGPERTGQNLSKWLSLVTGN